MASEHRWWHVPLTILMLIGLPLVALWDLPQTLRFERLLARARPGRPDLTGVVAVRWWTRMMPSIAEGSETLNLFELEYATGARTVVEDWDDYANVLAAHGLLPAAPVSLGYSLGPLAWLMWIAIVLPVIVILIIVCR